MASRKYLQRQTRDLFPTFSLYRRQILKRMSLYKQDECYKSLFRERKKKIMEDDKRKIYVNGDNRLINKDRWIEKIIDHYTLKRTGLIHVLYASYYKTKLVLTFNYYTTYETDRILLGNGGTKFKSNKYTSWRLFFWVIPSMWN